MLRASLGSLALALSLATASAADEPRAVLELFTSQGCASCPAADALLAELDGREDIIAVSMPVKLWDFLGWADTLATDALTKRQIAYSVARGDQDVFTPQMVVNGHQDVLGSDREAIERAIAADGEEHLPLPIALEAHGGVLSISVGEADIGADEASLWLLVIDHAVTVPVKGGENRGRELTYHNVVKHMRPIGMWKGEAMELDLPLADVERDATAGGVVIAQVETFKGPGRIVGAAEVEHLFPARRVASPR